MSSATMCDNSPDSLLELAARFCAASLLQVTRAQRPDAVDLSALCLPHEVGEQLFQAACELDRDLGDALVAVFRHTRLTRVRLRDCSVTDRGAKYLLRHKLRELDIHNCPQFTVSCRRPVRE